MSTRLIRYVGPFPEGVHVATGLGTEVLVEHGATVEVSVNQGEALLLQAANWEAADAPTEEPAKKPAKPRQLRPSRSRSAKTRAPAAAAPAEQPADQEPAVGQAGADEPAEPGREDA